MLRKKALNLTFNVSYMCQNLPWYIYNVCKRIQLKINSSVINLTYILHSASVSLKRGRGKVDNQSKRIDGAGENNCMFTGWGPHTVFNWIFELQPITSEILTQPSRLTEQKEIFSRRKRSQLLEPGSCTGLCIYTYTFIG